MKKTKVSGVLIYLLALVLVLLLYFYTVYTPLTAKVGALDLEHARNTEQITQYEQLIPQKEAIQAKIDALQAELDTQKSTDSITGKTVAEDVAAACRAAGVTPLNVQVTAEVPVKGKTASGGKQLYSVPVSVAADCSREQVQKLVDYFEKQSPGGYYVDSAEWKQDAQHPGVYSLTLTMTLYYFGTGTASK